MLDTLFTLLADPTIHAWYSGFCFALMVLPMLALAIWYHGRIRRTSGGRALMRRQGASAPSVGNARLGEGISMARDIASGRYGAEPRAMQRVVFWVVGAWVRRSSSPSGCFYGPTRSTAPPHPLEPRGPRQAACTGH